MGRDSGADYSLVELVAMFVVLADIPIIVVAVMAGPLYAVALAAVLLVAGAGAWYLGRRFERGDGTDATSAASDDPVTELQRRYAAGELSSAEFEEKLDRLVESDERAEAAGIDTEELSLETSE